MTVMPDASEDASTSSADANTRLGARVVVAAAALAVLVIPFALTLLLVEDRWAPLLKADRGARDGLHGYALGHPGFVTAMQLISDAGSAVTWTVVLAPVVGWLLWLRLPRLAVFVVVAAAGSSLLNEVVKTAVHRLRPVLSHPVAHEQGLSFPSGHAQSAVVGFTVLLIVFLPVLHGRWRGTAVALAVVAILAIGFSRIALGVHYVSDVLGGFFLGLAWVAAMAAAFNVIGVGYGRKVDETSPGSAADSQSLGDGADR